MSLSVFRCGLILMSPGCACGFRKRTPATATKTAKRQSTMKKGNNATSKPLSDGKKATGSGSSKRRSVPFLSCVLCRVSFLMLLLCSTAVVGE